MKDKILIVDDDKRLRELLEDYLTEKKIRLGILVQPLGTNLKSSKEVFFKNK